MSGRLEGKVAFITGAARGQGRSHALALAREGAGVIAVDACAEAEFRAEVLPGAAPDVPEAWMVPHAVSVSVPATTMSADSALVAESITCFPSP